MSEERIKENNLVDCKKLEIMINISGNETLGVLDKSDLINILGINSKISDESLKQIFLDVDKMNNKNH